MCTGAKQDRDRLRAALTHRSNQRGDIVVFFGNCIDISTVLYQIFNQLITDLPVAYSLEQYGITVRGRNIEIRTFFPEQFQMIKGIVFHRLYDSVFSAAVGNRPVRSGIQQLLQIFRRVKFLPITVYRIHNQSAELIFIALLLIEIVAEIDNFGKNFIVEVGLFHSAQHVAGRSASGKLHSAQ